MASSTQVQSTSNYYSFSDAPSDRELTELVISVNPEKNRLKVRVWEGEKTQVISLPLDQILPSLTGWLHDRLSKED